MSIDRLGLLREHNKQLLDQLRQHGEKLERLCGRSESRKREREDEAEERTPPKETVTVTGGDREPARAALAKPSVKFADVFSSGLQAGQFSNRILRWSHAVVLDAMLVRNKEAPKDVFVPSFPKHREGTAEQTIKSDLTRGSKTQDTGPFSTTSCLVNHSIGQRSVQSRVTFQSDECEDIPASERHHLPPLLGYDWIAGVLDTEDSLMERSDEFFSDLCVFRSLNKDECVHSAQTQFSEESNPVTPLLTDKNDPEANMDTHQCTFSYRINSRLFPVPLHSQECCPVCKKPKSSHPHTVAEPALIRVSIPCARLLPPYKHKAHRRSSFDPSDSLGLPSHCLSGWSNTGQSTLPLPSSLDLRSSVNMKNSKGPLSEELEALSALKVSGNQNLNQISDVTRLARHSFHHFSPKRRVGGTSYPAYPVH
ncbi:LOW QUALITY PROTEIN: migration and invasion inhibitory protein [Archocentrus centrarchus]|uniref:LOW QUALITY PROTEIN: migration and invasion inhibitory protein n=1 Tax=Archocentrus centrarchus TaxID=63155 RepID=UPI0011E9C4D1|nr:LOW QUALITY PROTEIN: migration and invasion-inhibitory protein [Archocentrus centrarchus]